MKLKKISNYEWELEQKGKMNVPGRIFASKELLDIVRNDKTLTQLRNMACLPGIQKYSIALPDAHQGYGFCIGGVAALSAKEGGISPGGVGFDINCGVRVMKTNLTRKQILPKIELLINELYKEIPSGLGSKGVFNLKRDELCEVLEKGISYLKDKGFATRNDLINCEEKGCMKNADSSKVSKKAIGRGQSTLGSLGSGNHFVDIHFVDELINEKIGKKFGFFKDQVVITIHSGSRGLGHQVASDYLRIIEDKFPEIVKQLPDKELIYAPANSEEAINYYKAMSASANFAWANRQLMMHKVRGVFSKTFQNSSENLGLELFYDVCHNIAKLERHEGIKCYVHRKGATRSYPSDKVIIPGSMGTSTYLLIGGNNSLEKTFGSAAHGSGRLMSRVKAKNIFNPEQVIKEMNSKGIFVKSSTIKGLSEEAPNVYKDVDEVVRVSNELGIANSFVRLTPLGVING